MLPSIAGNLLKRFLEQHRLPIILAIGAVLVMLPAMNTGLMGDDLPQRVIQYLPDQLPPNIHDTGNPVDTGSFGTVMEDLFFNRTLEDMTLMRTYGMLPWWTPDDTRFGLWRPVTAFTHWVDYRLFPDSPALMHLHNIAWYAGILLVLTLIYRQILGPAWPAGLAAVMFLLDPNTFFPVAFVANRGFILSLFCGLVCLHEHHQWRVTRLRPRLWWSLVFLTLAVLANEGGVSAFAFILAYGLALEPGSLWTRMRTVLPAVRVIVAWRVVYALCEFGPYHVGAYIDPSHEPLQFARELGSRALVMLAGQFSSLSPELLFAIKPSLQPGATAAYCVIAAVLLAVFIPWARCDKVAAFWFAATLFAVIPASTVVATTKNMGFVAVGAYGLMASFVAGLIARPVNWPEFRFYRKAAWVACALMLFAHIPGAIAGRIMAAGAINLVIRGINYLCNIGNAPDGENKNVIVVNAPCTYLLAAAPFYKAYHHQPLPRSMRLLAPGCTSLNIERADERTLVIQSVGPDIFAADSKGFFNIGYAFRSFNLAICKPMCKPGDHYDRGCMTVDVSQVDSENLPSQVVFHFDAPLDSTNFEWLRFDWRTFSYQPFKVPVIGKNVTLDRSTIESMPENKNAAD